MNTVSTPPLNAFARPRIAELFKPIAWLAARLYLPLFAGGMIAALLCLQLFVVGTLDRFSVSPQLSFLGLNLFVITVFATISLSPLVIKMRRAVSHSSVTTKAAKAKVPAASPKGVCKLLIIRRVNGVRYEGASGIFVHRRPSDEVVG